MNKLGNFLGNNNSPAKIDPVVNDWDVLEFNGIHDVCTYELDRNIMNFGSDEPNMNMNFDTDGWLISSMFYSLDNTALGNHWNGNPTLMSFVNDGPDSSFHPYSWVGDNGYCIRLGNQGLPYRQNKHPQIIVTYFTDGNKYSDVIADDSNGFNWVTSTLTTPNNVDQFLLVVFAIKFQAPNAIYNIRFFSGRDGGNCQKVFEQSNTIGANGMSTTEFPGFSSLYPRSYTIGGAPLQSGALSFGNHSTARESNSWYQNNSNYNPPMIRANNFTMWKYATNFTDSDCFEIWKDGPGMFGRTTKHEWAQVANMSTENLGGSSDKEIMDSTGNWVSIGHQWSSVTRETLTETTGINGYNEWSFSKVGAYTGT